MGDNIKDKTVSGLAWSAIDNIASQGITFLIGLILARLLTPEEFGTLGLALIFIGLLNQIIDCGFSNALIRKKVISEVDFNTAFIFNVIAGFVAFFLCFLLSPFISQFFDDPNLLIVLRWLSTLVIINAVGIVQRTILVRNIDFKTQTKISLISSILGGIVGVLFAYKGYGVMSLVYQQLSRQGSNTILLWVFNKWRPYLQFSTTSFKEQFTYGIKLLFSGLIDFTFNESSSLLIGKVYTPATLGQYSRARQFSSIFSSNLSAVMQRVTFPVLSKFQDEPLTLVSKYRLIVKCLMLLSGFFMITLACTAKPLILILIGEKWAQAILFLQIICFNDMLYPIKQVNINVIQVTGRSDLVLKVTLYKRILQIIPLFIGLYNIYYMLYGLVVASFCGLVLNALFASKCIPYKLSDQLKDLRRPFIACLIPGIVMFAISFLQMNMYILLIIQLIIGLVIFKFSCNTLRIGEYIYMKEIISNIFGKISSALRQSCKYK